MKSMKHRATMLAAMAAAFMPSESNISVSRMPTFKQATMPKKKWKQRKRRLELARDSRKQNRP